MSAFHRFKEYLQYLSIAKTRHGVHSPFVYDFVEKVLIGKSDKDLEERIENYFGSNNISFLETNSKSEFEKLFPVLNSDSVVIIRSIHESRSDTDEWKNIYSLPEIKLSIDLFDVGLLFFKNEFKDKQHFVLKA